MSMHCEDTLHHAARCLRDGGNPLRADFLIAHGLSAADVEEITGLVCTILEGYSNAPEHVRRLVRASASCVDRDQASLMVAHLDAAFSEGRIAEMARKAPRPGTN